MMQILGGIALVLGIVGFSVWSYVEAYERGQRKGFDRGWKASEEWLVRAESDVDRERQKIWREEG